MGRRTIESKVRCRKTFEAPHILFVVMVVVVVLKRVAKFAQDMVKVK